jgi:hypothetical protein
MNTTTIESNESRIDSILAMVATPEPAPELSLATRARLEEAKRRAYHRARSEGKTRDEAESVAQAAYDVECELILREQASLPAPVQAPPKDAPPFIPPGQVPVVPVPRPSTPPMPNIEAGAMDHVGAERSRADAAAAIAAGFSPVAPVYERGSRVNETGVANARRSRVEHDAKPLVVDAATDLISRIRGEQRRIAVVPSGNIGMHEDGRVALFSTTVDGKDAGDMSLALSRSAFGSLLSRLGIGGADYLARLPAKARAANVNLWRSIISGSDPEMAKEATDIAQSMGREPAGTAESCAFRVRTRGGKDEAFAVVSPEYSPFDADIIADAIRRTCLSAPTMTTTVDGQDFIADLSKARGRMTYDGAKSRFEVMFHSDVRPEGYVAGEFFKAGVLVRTDDTGGGSCKVVPVIWQNLCLNLIILDVARGDEISIRHVGSVAKLTAQFEKAFMRSLDKIGHFLKAWGYACKETMMEATRKAYAKCPANEEKALPGLFNGMLQTGLVSIPGKRRDVVNELVRQWHADNSSAKTQGLTRASLVNALTRYAHTIQIDDPWAEDEIQRDAGRLLFNASDPVPYVSLDEVVETTSMMARAS